MNNLTFQGIWRMDWGFGNPNKTAAFIAILMVAIWAVAYIRRWGFWIALIGFVGLGIALIHTFSRGGLVSLLAGIVPVLLWTPRPWSRSKIIGVVVGFWVMIGASIYLKAHERYAQGISVEDSSISNRIQLWKSVPAMIVNAPSGWGGGNAGNAYMQWYQPLDKSETYRTLVNSHLTWLVEFDWPQRLLYIFAWSVILLICWPSRQTPWRAIALGVWLCFLVAAFFSSVAESPVMWVVPLLALIVALIHRIATSQFPSRIQWLVPVGGTIILSSGFWIAGQFSPLIHGSKNIVIVGGSKPAIFVFYDPATMGSLYGKAIRQTARAASSKNLPTLGLVFSDTAIPDVSGQTLVLGSTLPTNSAQTITTAVARCHRLILLNPRYFPEEIGVNSANIQKVVSYFGEFSESPSIEMWRSYGSCKTLPGVGDFLSAWPEYILSERN